MIVDPTDRGFVDEFLRTYTNEGTRKTYLETLEKFSRYLSQSEIKILDASTKDVLNFIFNRHVPLARSTQVLHYYVIKGLFEYGTTKGITSNNPTKNITKPKKQQFGDPKCKLKNSDITKLLDLTRYGSSTEIRSNALISTIYYGALKISEALNLKIGQLIQKENRQFIVIRKATSERHIPLGLNAFENISRYINLLPNPDVDAPFFWQAYNNTGEFLLPKPLTRRGAVTSLRIINQKYDLGPDWSFEQVRNAGIMNLLEKGMNLRQLQKITGVRKLETLERFCKTESTDEQLYRLMTSN